MFLGFTAPGCDYDITIKYDNIISHLLDTSCSPTYKRAIFTISDQ